MDEKRKATRRKVRAMSPEKVALLFEAAGLTGLELAIMQNRFLFSHSVTKTARETFSSRATLIRHQARALDKIGKVLR